MSVDIPALLNDVQTGVVRGANAQVVAYLFFRITDAATFLKQLPDGKAPTPGLGVTTATFCPEALRDTLPAPSASTPATSFALANIAFTYNGLVALGIDGNTLVTFPEAFREGMAHRAAFLGDKGRSAPEYWQGHLGSRGIHGVVWASFQLADPTDAAAIGELFAQLRAALGNIPVDGVSSAQSGGSGGPIVAAPIPGAEVMHVEVGRANYRDGYTVEHFGFRDGISQPFVDIGKQSPTGGAPTKHGELLLGYEGEQGSIPQLLPVNKRLRDNGTYMVFRKLEQDVIAFRDFVKEHGDQKPERLAAQMVGRWRNGSPLVLDPEGPSPVSDQTINKFDFLTEDPKGLVCPIGAHIRRSNPRKTNDREDEAKRHRLFRRGISYGEPLPDDATSNGTPRGLFFISLQARIDRQFEFVQGRWLNGGEFAGQAGAHLDPLTGSHDRRVRDAFHPAGRRAPITCLPRFVTLRGGDYFFVPSFTALAAMKANDKFKPDDPLPPSSPHVEEALGMTQPSKAADHSKEIAKVIGELMMPSGAPPFKLLDDGMTIVVARHALVKAVLADAKSFSSGVFSRNGDLITGGKLDGVLVTPGRGLLVGMTPDNPERQARMGVLMKAMASVSQRFSPGALATLAETLAAEALKPTIKRQGWLDVVDDFGRVVPVGAIRSLFGVSGPNEFALTAYAAHFGRPNLDIDVPEDWKATMPTKHPRPVFNMQVWTRLTFLQIFINLVNAQEMRDLGAAAGLELLRRIDELIQLTPEPIGTPDNLLEAFVKEYGKNPPADTKEHVRLLLAEFVAGAVETVNAALANAINYVLDNEQKVRRAILDRRKLSDTGAPLAELVGLLDDDDDDLDRLILEILRFDPMGPTSLRHAIPGAQIGGMAVPPAKNAALPMNVALVISAAMLDGDPAAFRNPREIDFDRPLDNYLHFGTAPHRCAGRDIAQPLLREMFRTIVKLPNLRRTPGVAGEKKQDYPLLVDKLVVSFDPH